MHLCDLEYLITFPVVQANLLWSEPTIEALPRHYSGSQDKEK